VANLDRSDAERGLYEKFVVERTDGSDGPGGRHYGCRYFVLDLDHDPHSLPALRAYAESCAADSPKLAADLLALAGVQTGTQINEDFPHAEPYDVPPDPEPGVRGEPWPQGTEAWICERHPDGYVSGCRLCEVAREKNVAAGEPTT
jgi:hypothetical protein